MGTENMPVTGSGEVSAKWLPCIQRTYSSHIPCLNEIRQMWGAAVARELGHVSTREDHVRSQLAVSVMLDDMAAVSCNTRCVTILLPSLWGCRHRKIHEKSLKMGENYYRVNPSK